MTVQEYRSRVFSAMFKRYLSQHQELDMCDDEIKIDGVTEPFFFHVIYHKEHQTFAEMIAEGHIFSDVIWGLGFEPQTDHGFF